MRIRLSGCLLVALFVCTVATSGAATVFDNGGPSTSNGYPIDGANSTTDDFSLGSNTAIMGVGFYFQNYSGITGWNQDISYNIRADNSGVPGTILASGLGQDIMAVDSGLPWCCGGNAFLVTFNLQTPFSATAGSIDWLELTGATGAANAFWVTTNANSTHTGYYNTGQGFAGTGAPGEQFAFFLTDTPFAQGVPEPGSFTLVGAAAVMLGAFLFRRPTARV